MEYEIYLVVARCGYDGIFPLPIRKDEYNPDSDAIYYRGSKEDCEKYIEGLSEL